MALVLRLAANSARSVGAVAELNLSAFSVAARCSSQALQHFTELSHSSATPAAAAAAAAALFSTSALSRSLQQQHQQPWQQRLGLDICGNSTTSGVSSSISSGRGLSSSAAAGSQCDCPTLGGPTPDVVTVEYDEEEVDRFIALADAIEEAFPNVVVEGNPTGPGRQGSFEVTGANGALLFSKLGSGSWPEAESVVDAIGLAASCDVQQQ